MLVKLPKKQNKSDINQKLKYIINNKQKYTLQFKKLVSYLIF